MAERKSTRRRSTKAEEEGATATPQASGEGTATLAAHPFGPGTEVAVHPAGPETDVQRREGTAPLGEEVASSTVGDDATLEFSGLEPGMYVAVAQAEGGEDAPYVYVTFSSGLPGASD
jgi:hypothetical protein